MSKYSDLLMHESYRQLFANDNSELPDNDSNLDSPNLPFDDEDDEESSESEADETDGDS